MPDTNVLLGNEVQREKKNLFERSLKMEERNYSDRQKRKNKGQTWTWAWEDGRELQARLQIEMRCLSELDCVSMIITHTHNLMVIWCCVSVEFLWRLVSGVNFSLHVSLKLLGVWLSTLSPDPWPLTSSCSSQSVFRTEMPAHACLCVYRDPFLFYIRYFLCYLKLLSLCSLSFLAIN